MEKIFIYFEVLITGMYFKTLVDANIIWKIKKYGYILLYLGYYKT